MLRTRVFTAVVLLALLLPALLWSPLAWGALTVLFVTAAAWEWARLLGRGAVAAPVAAVVALGGVAALAWRHAGGGWPPAALLLLAVPAAAYWILGGGIALARHDARAGGVPLALLLLAAAWAALVELRDGGVALLLSAMALVWVADVAAYFVGRSVGRRKLAPSISPGKTWEGALGAAVVVALAGIAIAHWAPHWQTLPALLVSRLGDAGAALVLLALAAVSVVGDLHESLVKRQAGVKDSGRTLPGHGGVLDRIDALVAVMPVALLLVLLLR